MEKLYLTIGEVVDRVERILRDLPLGWQWGIEYAMTGTMPPYLRVWFDGLTEGFVNEYFIRENELDAANILGDLNHMRIKVNELCRDEELFDAPKYSDEELPF